MSSRPNLQTLLALAASVLLSALPSERVLALYPDRIVRIVVPFAPGGGTDVIARSLAQEMAKDLGATVVVENKPGAGTILGTQAVATSVPDGYTLLLGTFAHAVNPSLNAKLPYDAHRDFAPVALIARSYNIVVVNPKSSITSIADLIAAAKADPGKIVLWDIRNRHVGASGRRAVQEHGRRRSDGGALQGRRARHLGPDRRSY
jgi:tripartite-type tricarboxylate transporter receptor subunit TctC